MTLKCHSRGSVYNIAIRRGGAALSAQIVDFSIGSELGALSGAVCGAAIGSYLATLALRWPEGRSAAAGRSHCDSCGITIPTLRMIPMLSWTMQGGRCHACGSRIAVTHPLLEVCGALIGALSGGLFHGAPTLACATAAFGMLLLLAATLDLRHFWLPDRLSLAMAVAGLAVNALGLGPGLVPALAGALAGYGSLWLIARAYRALRGREGLGGGDAKLLGAIGAWTGWSGLPWIVLGASLAGLAAVLVLVLRGGSAGGAMRLPLGTLLAVAAWPIWIVLALAF